MTIAVNDTPAAAPPLQVEADDLSRAPMTLSPARAVADAGSVNVAITGAGFEPGMIATWNGQSRPTQFVSSAKLTVTLTAADLESPGIGMIAVWDSTRTNQITRSASFLVWLPILNNDLVYDQLRDRIYVAVPAAQKPQGASIAVLNPETGRIESYHPLATDPEKLAISDDGVYLYVGVAGSVQRISLNSWNADLTIPLDVKSLGQGLHVYSMLALPGANRSLAVSFTSPFVSPGYLGTAIFDDAQVRPTVLPGNVGPAYLLGGPGAGPIYAGDERGNFYALAISSGGVQVTREWAGLLEGDGDSVYAGGLVYAGWGEAVDPSIPSVTAKYDNAGLIAPFPDSGKVLILGTISQTAYATPASTILSLHDAESGFRLWSLPISLSSGQNHGPMIRWGQNGIALREAPAYNTQPAAGIDLFRVQLDR